MNDEIELELISDETHVQGTYDVRDRKYCCPCGKGILLLSKERPNGSGYGYEATYSDVFCYCDDCKEKYEFSTFPTVSAKLK